MLSKNNLFNNFLLKKEININLQKTKKIFQSLKNDLKNFDIPMLHSYEKDYELDFSKNIIKKFSKFKNIVIIGMGGSILGAKSIYSFFKKKIKKNVFFFDNLDSSQHLKFKKIKNIKNSCFVVVSKSGNTLETVTNLNIIFSKNLLKGKLILITEIKDNVLMDIAAQFNANVIEHKEYIGGRYSVLSETGMFPAALMGLQIDKFRNLKKLIDNKNFVSALIQNVTSIYELSKRGKSNSVILSYDSSFNDLSYWYQQLIGESLGKDGKGITPMVSFGPKDHHSLLQLYLDGPKDKFFTFFTSSKNESNLKVNNVTVSKKMNFLRKKNLHFISNAQSSAVKKIFKLKKIPFRQIIINKKSEEELGAIFTFFVLETILLSKLFKVNPFSQPAVENVKRETKI